MDLYSVFDPVIPCLSIKIKRLFVKIKVSRNNLKPISMASPSIKILAKSFYNCSGETVPALPKMAENKPIKRYLIDEN